MIKVTRTQTSNDLNLLEISETEVYKALFTLVLRKLVTYYIEKKKKSKLTGF